MKAALGSLLWASCWVNSSHQCQKSSSVQLLGNTGNYRIIEVGRDCGQAQIMLLRTTSGWNLRVPSRDILQPLWASMPMFEHHRERFPGKSSCLPLAADTIPFPMPQEEWGCFWQYKRKQLVKSAPFFFFLPSNYPQRGGRLRSGIRKKF